MGTLSKDVQIKHITVAEALLDQSLTANHVLFGCTVCGKPNNMELLCAGDMKYTMNTVNGDCGRPFMFWDNNVWRLQGIHSYGANKFTKFNSSSPFFSLEEAYNFESIELAGTLNRNMNSITSSFVPDNFARIYLNKYDLVKYDNYELKEINPEVYKKGIAKYHGKSWTLEPSRMTKVVDAIWNRMWEKYSRFRNVDNLTVLKEKLKRDGSGTLNHTSPGYPWNTLDHDKVTFINKQIHALWNGIETGEIMQTEVFGTNLPKDEVRAIIKDIRFILSMPIHHTAVGCYLLGSHFQFYKQDVLDPLNPVAIGLDLNRDMDTIYAALLGFDSSTGYISRSNIFSGDFDACDTNMSAWILQHVCDEMYAWKYASGDTDFATQALWDWYVKHNIHTYIRTPPNEVYQKHGGTPSGSYSTSDLNTKCTSWMTIYAIVKSYWDVWSSKSDAQIVDEYLRNFRSKHAGDDFIVATSSNYPLTRKTFAANLPGTCTVTFDYPDLEQKAQNSTLLSMRPTTLVVVNNELQVEALHNKLERVFVKMAFKRPEHSDTVFYEKVCSALVWAWYDVPTRTSLIEIKEELESTYRARGLNFVYVSNDCIAQRKGYLAFESGVKTRSLDKPASPGLNTND